MKKRRFLASIALIVSTLAVVTSCQQDESFEITKSSQQRFLDVAPNYLDNITYCANDTNLVNVTQAFERISVFGMEKARSNHNAAQELRISPKLFDYILSLSNSSEATKTRITAKGNDCVAWTNANVYCEFEGALLGMRDSVYKYTWKYIARHYGEGLVWDENGYNFESLLRCCYRVVATGLTADKNTYYNYTMDIDSVSGGFASRVIGVISIDKNTFHSVTIQAISNGNVWYRDDQNGGYAICPIESLKMMYGVSHPYYYEQMRRKLEYE